MAVAAPPAKPSARKRRKSGALPDGMKQHSLEALFAPAQVREPEVLPAPVIEAPPIVIHPAQVSQLDFDALMAQEPDAGGWTQGAFSNRGAVSRSAASSRTKRKKKPSLPEGIKQFSFEDLFTTTSPLAYPEPEASDKKPEEVYRPAPRKRNKAKKKTGLPEGMEQPTLDGLFAPSGETEAQTAPTLEGGAAYERPGHSEQPDFDALEQLLPSVAGAISPGEPAGGGTESEEGALLRPVVPPGGGAEDEPPGSLGYSDPRTAGARGRRVVLDEPESELKPSRDFRITEAHGVGAGGLHEKARANIAAIRLLKTLEEENREATDEEKAVLVRYSGWATARATAKAASAG